MDHSRSVIILDTYSFNKKLLNIRDNTVTLLDKKKKLCTLFFFYVIQKISHVKFSQPSTQISRRMFLPLPPPAMTNYCQKIKYTVASKRRSKRRGSRSELRQRSAIARIRTHACKYERHAREKKEKGQGEKMKREKEPMDGHGRRGKSLNGIPSGPSNATQR